MPRIAGVDIPLNKRIEVGLTYIYGIGRKTSIDILSSAAIDSSKRSKDLDDGEVAKLREVIENQFTVEGDLRKEVPGQYKKTCRNWMLQRYKAQTGFACQRPVLKIQCKNKKRAQEELL